MYECGTNTDFLSIFYAVSLYFLQKRKKYVQKIKNEKSIKNNY